MNIFLIPLKYLYLRDEAGRALWRRNILAVIVIILLLSLPFVLFNANYFGEKGFLDRFGSFCGILTGFYIAALVGIASFSSTIGNLDTELNIGKIFSKDNKGDGVSLTRREYVSAIFGYLSFISFALSILAIVFLVTASAVKDIAPAWLGYVVIFVFNAAVAHMIVTTCHGLYYFIDRLYYQEAKLLPRKDA